MVSKCTIIVSSLLLLGACNEGSSLMGSRSFSPSTVGRLVKVSANTNDFAASDSMEPREFKLERNDSAIRGESYASVNSTIPTGQQAAQAVGVVPPLEASAKVWKRAWNLHRRVMPLLHFFDKMKPPDSSLALMCLWWKALSANDCNSPAFDNSLVYDLLPSGTRLLVGKRLQRFYPRLHHANVEIRTVYLDQQVMNIIAEVKMATRTKKIRLVTLGGGYDVRSIKFRERGLVDQAVELDLPDVIDAKQKIFQSKRLKLRRPWLTSVMMPSFHSVNLNNVEEVREILNIILSDEKDSTMWHTIFLFEGVMIYLDEHVPRRLLEICSAVLKNSKEGSLVFADRLDNIPGGDYAIGISELAETGWNIVDWQPKPGLARHMGRAKLVLNS